jgi:hypothetical protein
VPLEGLYNQIKLLEIKIMAFANGLTAQELSQDEVSLVDKYKRAVRRTVVAAKTMKDIQEDMDDFATDDNAFIQHAYRYFRKRLILLFNSVIWLMEGKDRAVEELEKSFGKIKMDHDSHLDMVVTAIKAGKITETEGATLINVNHSVFRTSRAILEVVTLLMDIELPERGLDSA